MANLIVDGFATYGTTTFQTQDDVRNALKAGAYAEVAHQGATVGTANVKLIQALPWDTASKDWWLALSGGINIGSTIQYAARRVLPAAKAKVRVSLHMALGQLPVGNSAEGPIAFRDSSNSTIASLYVDTTGALRLDYGSGDLLTSGPVVVAERDHHIEMEIDVGGTFQLYVDGTQVMNGSGITFDNTNDIAQFILGFASSSSYVSENIYITSLIVRDDSGGYNNSFPIGDRRVATLLPDADDSDHHGWTPQPLLRFGVGICDMTAGSTAIVTTVSTTFDLGVNDFTLEGQFRFQRLPTGANKATLFGKWDGDNDERAYELYLGGPDLDNGLLVWRTSTDGTEATVEDTVKWEWKPDIGHWYHIAMCRSDDELLLFIDGVQQGIPVAANTPFAASTPLAIGSEMSGSNVEPNTYFDGWIDEWRFTLGNSRYTANFTPPTEGFPRLANDPDWASVVWLSSFNNGTVTDDGPNAISLSTKGTVSAITPNDGVHDFEVLNKNIPDDDTFLEAALIAATGLFTMTDLPTADETVTVGTTSGGTAAVYKFVATPAAAYDVAIGADIATTAANLVAAINAGAGEGTAYGTDTEANVDVSALQLPSNQVKVVANVPGTDGNSIATTETCTNASWGGTVLSGGLDIPGYSQFGLSRMPANTTVVDSVTLVARQWKTDSGTGTTKLSFIGASGTEAQGAAVQLGTLPNLTFDTFEEDPDTSAALTPSSVLLGKMKIDRTA